MSAKIREKIRGGLETRDYRYIENKIHIFNLLFGLVNNYLKLLSTITNYNYYILIMKASSVTSPVVDKALPE